MSTTRKRSLRTLRTLATLSLLLLICIFFRHRLISIHSTNTHLSKTFTEPHTNITLLITGQCMYPFTYLGVDTRPPLLNYYDLRATPATRYSPPKANWARAALLKFAFNECRSVKWFIYTDTDAYLESRDAVWRRFVNSAPHVIYQHGMWSLNSGVSAWHNTAKAHAVLNDWLQRYVPSNNFFAEQSAMLHAVERFSKYTVGRPNGYLGWHIKGSAKHKTYVANVGRLLCYYEHTIAWVLLAPLWAITALTAFAIIRLKFTRSVTGVKPFVQVAVLIGWLLRNDLFVLFSCAVVLLLFLITKTDLLGTWQQHTVSALSSLNFTHLLPGGKIMLTKDLLCSGFWCIKPVKRALSGRVHRLLLRLSTSRRLTVGIFLFYGLCANVVPRFIVASVFAVSLVTTIAVVCRAVNLGNIFVMHDVADGLFRSQRPVFGAWNLRAVAPTVDSGSLAVVKERDRDGR